MLILNALVISYILISCGFICISKDTQKTNFLGINLITLAWLIFTSTQTASPANFVYAWTPLLLLPLLYRNTELMTKVISKEKYDQPLIKFENRYFAGVMNFHQKNACSHLLFSEYLHACYLSFYFLIYAVPLYFYFHNPLFDFYKISFAILFSLCACFVTHAFIPVDGPRTIFAKINDQRSAGWFFKQVHFILERGSSAGTAFPSGHTALASSVMLITWHLNPGLCLCIMPIAIGLIVSTVYGRFHYVIDVIFGILYALISYTVTLYFYD